MQKIYLNEVNSTNTFLIDSLAKGTQLEEGSVVYTFCQTAGRGQIGNSWESEPEKNITFSILLRPKFLPIREQFYISEITCLAITEALATCDIMNLSIKWPNDIYCKDDKICGILIENSLMGSTFDQCIIGIGINVNQTKWIGNAPNPTSIKLCIDKDFNPEEILDKVYDKIMLYYSMLQSGMKDEIHRRYLNNIYRKDGFFPYMDAETGKEFSAQIKTIEPSGYLLLEDTEGSEYRYMFKEVKFVLPCGITKE